MKERPRFMPLRFRFASLLLAAVLFSLTTGVGAEGDDALLRGQELSRAGQFEEAILQFDAAIRLQPQSAEAHFHRGVAYMETGKTTRPLEDFNEAIRLKPDYAEAYYRPRFFCLNSSGIAVVEVRKSACQFAWCES
jgi:tetratricopeptide (TPR) repeat protein